MPRRPLQEGIAGSAGALVTIIGRLLWVPARLAWRPLAARSWDRYLAEEIERRPRDKVKVFDAQGQLLGWGLREQIDRTHTGFGVPFAWSGKAASVKDEWDKEIRGARFYFGKSGWLLDPILPRRH
jgi:hypothetical protein